MARLASRLQKNSRVKDRWFDCTQPIGIQTDADRCGPRVPNRAGRCHDIIMVPRHMTNIAFVVGAGNATGNAVSNPPGKL